MTIFEERGITKENIENALEITADAIGQGRVTTDMESYMYMETMLLAIERLKEEKEMEDVLRENLDRVMTPVEAAEPVKEIVTNPLLLKSVTPHHSEELNDEDRIKPNVLFISRELSEIEMNMQQLCWALIGREPVETDERKPNCMAEELRYCIAKTETIMRNIGILLDGLGI